MWLFSIFFLLLTDQNTETVVSLMFAWTTWSKIRVSVLHLEDLDLFDWNNWVSQENKMGKWETIIYIVTLPEKIRVFFTLNLEYSMMLFFLLFFFHLICFFCFSLSLFPFICHHWQLRENVYLLTVFFAESAFGSESRRQKNPIESFQEHLEITWILFNLEDGWEASASPGIRLLDSQQSRVLLPWCVLVPDMKTLTFTG